MMKLKVHTQRLNAAFPVNLIRVDVKINVKHKKGARVENTKNTVSMMNTVFSDGTPSGIRTLDTLIKSQVL